MAAGARHLDRESGRRSRPAGPSTPSRSGRRRRRARTARPRGRPPSGRERRSSTIVSAPWWCAIIEVRKRRSNSGPRAAASAAICASVSMPGMRAAWSPPCRARSSGGSGPRSTSQLLELGDLVGLGDPHPLGEEADVAARTVALGERGHLERLLVVRDHVPHERDVRLARLGALVREVLHLVGPERAVALPGRPELDDGSGAGGGDLVGRRRRAPGAGQEHGEGGGRDERATVHEGLQVLTSRRDHGSVSSPPPDATAPSRDHWARSVTRPTMEVRR